MAQGNICNCSTIKRRHLDYECNLTRLDAQLYPDGWNSIYKRAQETNPMSTEPRLGTSSNPRHTFGRGKVEHIKLDDCVNWREGESASAQPLTVGEPCPTCRHTYLGEMGDGDYSCVEHGMGMKEPCEHWKKTLAESSEAVPPAAAQPCIDCGQPESDKAHDPDCPSIIDRHKFEAVPPTAETAMTAEQWNMPEERLQEHVIQLGAIAMAGINQPLWHTRQKLALYLEEKVFPDVREAAQGVDPQEWENAKAEIKSIREGKHPVQLLATDQLETAQRKLAEVEKVLRDLVNEFQLHLPNIKERESLALSAALASLRAESKEG